jgi:hypothetical protein
MTLYYHRHAKTPLTKKMQKTVTCKFGALADKRPVSVLIFKEQWILPSLQDIRFPYVKKARYISLRTR